jgi:hypothetical protein
MRSKEYNYRCPREGCYYSKYPMHGKPKTKDGKEYNGCCPVCGEALIREEIK